MHVSAFQDHLLFQKVGLYQQLKNRQFWLGFKVYTAQYYSDYEQGKLGCTKVALTA